MTNEFQEMVPGAVRKHKVPQSYGAIWIVAISMFVAGVAVAAFIFASLTSNDLKRPQKEASVAISPSPKKKIDAVNAPAVQPLTKAEPSTKPKKDSKEEKPPKDLKASAKPKKEEEKDLKEEKSGFAGLPPIPLEPAPDRDDHSVLNVMAMRVGDRGVIDAYSFEVVQIVASGKMLVELESSVVMLGQRDPRGYIKTLVMLKYPTDGLVDGMATYRGDKEVSALRKVKFKVTGTETYKTVGGGSKTVFVLEPSR